MNASEAPNQGDPPDRPVEIPSSRRRARSLSAPSGAALERLDSETADATDVARVRAHRAVDRLLQGLPSGAAAHAASAETDLDVLTEVLRSAPYPPKVADPRVAAAYARGRAAKETLLQAEGGMVGSKELTARLGLRRQTVDKRRQTGRVLGVQEGGVWLYPMWQFGADGECLRGFEQVLHALRESEHGAWAPVIFFLQGETADGDSPLEALRAGRIEAAVQAARMYGSHGAK